MHFFAQNKKNANFCKTTKYRFMQDKKNEIFAVKRISKRIFLRRKENTNFCSKKMEIYT
jgi:hypothetical protein